MGFYKKINNAGLRVYSVKLSVCLARLIPRLSPQHYKKIMIQARKMSQWVVSCHNLDNLSLIPRTHTRRGKSTPEIYPLISSWYVHICHSACLCLCLSYIHTQIHMYTPINYNNNKGIGYAEVNSLKEIKEVIAQSCSPESGLHFQSVHQ